MRHKKIQEERRIDPMLDGRAVTYLECSEGHRDQGLNEDVLKEHWNNLQVTAMPKDCTEEMRVDPANGQACTLEQLTQICQDQYSTDEIRDYWQCMAPSSADELWQSPPSPPSAIKW